MVKHKNLKCSRNNAKFWRSFLLCIFVIGAFHTMAIRADSSWMGDFDYSPGRCTVSDATSSMELAWKCPFGDRDFKHGSKDKKGSFGKLNVEIKEIKNGVLIQLTSNDKDALVRLKAMAKHMKVEHQEKKKK